eukprot:8387814-Lingulodinium_polyedra.AAC.1
MDALRGTTQSPHGLLQSLVDANEEVVADVRDVGNLDALLNARGLEKPARLSNGRLNARPS